MRRFERRGDIVPSSVKVSLDGEQITMLLNYTALVKSGDSGYLVFGRRRLTLVSRKKGSAATVHGE